MIRLLVLLLMLSGTAEAAEVVLFVASDPQDAVEQAVQQELTLGLDDLGVRAVTLASGFAGAPLAHQLDLLAEPLSGDDVFAAAWLDPARDPLRLQLAFAGASGRTVVRIVEEPAGPGAAETLALAAREVLASARLPDVAPPPPAVQQPTPAPPPAAPDPRPPLVEPPRAPRGAIGVDVGLAAATPLAAGPRTRVVLGGGGELFLPRGFLLGLHAAFRLARGGDSLLSTGLGGGLRLAWLGGGDAFGIGPFVGFGAAWLRTSQPFADGRLHADHLNLRVPLGLELWLHSDGAFSLTARFSADILPRRNVVLRRSDGSVALDTGPLDASVLVGVRARL